MVEIQQANKAFHILKRRIYIGTHGEVWSGVKPPSPLQFLGGGCGVDLVLCYVLACLCLLCVLPFVVCLLFRILITPFEEDGA